MKCSARRGSQPLVDFKCVSWFRVMSLSSMGERGRLHYSIFGESTCTRYLAHLHSIDLHAARTAASQSCCWKKKIHSLLQLSLWPSSWASSTIKLSMGLPTKEVCFVHTDQHDPWLVTTTWSREWDWCNKYSLKSFWSSTSPTSNVKTISWPGYITI